MTEEDLMFFRKENNKYKAHIEKSEIVKVDLLNKCNELEIEAINYGKDKAFVKKIAKENIFLLGKVASMDKAYAEQLSVMADAILKMEEMSRTKDSKQKDRVDSLQDQLRKMKMSESYARNLLTKIDANDENEEDLDNFKSITTHMQAKRIAELEAQLEESQYTLSAFKRANTYMSDIAKGDEKDFCDELAKSNRETEKFMSELESLESDITSDIRHLEKGLSEW
eukprot:CAMPEP_0197835954 /NCGR_PEP_ID=MMETSP1437-20131217/27488_1 /TAXON_ID=49252 ORGANISM="Eucampia antarctica, Strain CCMP1452" /NCGR_SAMPLE_ID=MMETSP1437 /ASSEMBLY_ACC=CAM_ASM_001096 /LENGTH=224 /DNA_ID=CAMNT_0043441769 /DNA_START=89 /DNA_END=763 /DNA_ORIENTATION=+